MTTELLVRDEKIVRIVTTEFDRVVDYNDIEGRAESDDWSNAAPWEDCDGWEHETRKLDYWDHDDITESRGYARCGRGDNRLIEVDDNDIINKWGFTRLAGESKQVWLERVARIKRKALDQLVKWYTDGWHVSQASAEYGDYTDCVGGIWDEPWSDYTADCVEECRANVADQMESDGYIVENKPEPPKPYNRVDRERDHIRRNLDMS